ncbi:MAG TPA: GNAT family N-acetyltransferase [Solirubrobacteraceae bacterium]|nr:GNAT family N-acetyltransferase [Solirubrobacteraceae bacterium]
MSEVEFRAERADARAARALLDAYADDLRGRLGEFDETRGVTADPDEMTPPAGIFLVGYADGEAVACGGYKVRSDGAEIKRMWVAPAARRRGVGRRLLAALEDAARAAGHRRVVLDTSAGQPEALAMYRRLGYVEVPDYNGNPYAAHWFEKAV